MAGKRPGTVELKWADGEHAFRLGIGQLGELQEKTNAGPMELVKGLQIGRWRIDGLGETLRPGFIGGEAKPTDALRLTQRYVDEQPLAESILPAQAVLMGCMYGEAPEDQKPR